MTLGDVIKTYRTEHSLSMDEFAKRSGLSKGYISMLEKNRNPKTGKPIIPSILTYQSVAKAMSTSVDVLMKTVDKEQLVSLEQTSAPTSDNLSTFAQRDSAAHSRRDMNDLAKFLNKTEVLFDGDTYSLSEEDQQKLRSALEFVFWDAKRQNKRKKD